jgi:c-di-GMP-related signal transduction protein
MYNESTKKATMRYLAKLKEIKVRIKPEEYERYREASKQCGWSMRKFMLESMNLMIRELEKEDKVMAAMHEEYVRNEFCKNSGCHYFDGFGCTRSPVIKDEEEKMPCDYEYNLI